MEYFVILIRLICLGDSRAIAKHQNLGVGIYLNADFGYIGANKTDKVYLLLPDHTLLFLPNLGSNHDVGINPRPNIQNQDHDSLSRIESHEKIIYLTLYNVNKEIVS